MGRVIGVSEDIAVRALIVDAIDEDARKFYLAAGFLEFPQDRMRLALLLKDLRASFREP